MIFNFQYIEKNKSEDNDWFRLEANQEGTRWFGKCWHIQDRLKYEFEVIFDVSRMDGNVGYRSEFSNLHVWMLHKLS